MSADETRPTDPFEIERGMTKLASIPCLANGSTSLRSLPFTKFQT